jgi:hypothetical protein
MATQALNFWRDRFFDLIEEARCTDDMGEAERDRLVEFVTREIGRIFHSPHRDQRPDDPWGDLGYRRDS